MVSPGVPGDEMSLGESLETGPAPDAGAASLPAPVAFMANPKNHIALSPQDVAITKRPVGLPTAVKFSSTQNYTFSSTNIMDRGLFIHHQGTVTWTFANGTGVSQADSYFFQEQSVQLQQFPLQKGLKSAQVTFGNNSLASNCPYLYDYYANTTPPDILYRYDINNGACGSNVDVIKNRIPYFQTKTDRFAGLRNDRTNAGLYDITITNSTQAPFTSTFSAKFDVYEPIVCLEGFLPPWESLTTPGFVGILNLELTLNWDSEWRNEFLTTLDLPVASVLAAGSVFSSPVIVFQNSDVIFKSYQMPSIYNSTRFNNIYNFTHLQGVQQQPVVQLSVNPGDLRNVVIPPYNFNYPALTSFPEYFVINTRQLPGATGGLGLYRYRLSVKRFNFTYIDVATRGTTFEKRDVKEIILQNNGARSKMRGSVFAMTIPTLTSGTATHKASSFDQGDYFIFKPSDFGCDANFAPGTRGTFNFRGTIEFELEAEIYGVSTNSLLQFGVETIVVLPQMLVNTSGTYETRISLFNQADVGAMNQRIAAEQLVPKHQHGATDLTHGTYYGGSFFGKLKKIFHHGVNYITSGKAARHLDTAKKIVHGIHQIHDTFKGKGVPKKRRRIL